MNNFLLAVNEGMDVPVVVGVSLVLFFLIVVLVYASTEGQNFERKKERISSYQLFGVRNLKGMKIAAEKAQFSDVIIIGNSYFIVGPKDLIPCDREQYERYEKLNSAERANFFAVYCGES